MKTLNNPLRFGVVRRVYVSQRQPVCDVLLSDGGYYVAVPLRRTGQGSFALPKDGATVQLYFPDGRTDLPYVVGVEPNGGIALSDQRTESDEDSDHTASLYDGVTQHDGSALVLSASGVSLQTEGSAVRVQLKSGQVFRVSVEGEADDNALRGQAFIDTLFLLLVDYEARLGKLETALNGLTAGNFVPVITQNSEITKLACELTKSDALKLK